MEPPRNVFRVAMDPISSHQHDRGHFPFTPADGSTANDTLCLETRDPTRPDSYKGSDVVPA